MIITLIILAFYALSAICALWGGTEYSDLELRLIRRIGNEQYADQRYQFDKHYQSRLQEKPVYWF